jgi:CheY-like chemotaxis protein
MILMTHGYDIECTANDVQAWKMWRAKRPDLILVVLDIRDTRVFDLLERIRRHDTSQMVLGLRPRLCSVLFDGCIVRRETPADDILAVAQKIHADVPRTHTTEVQ